MDDYATGQQPYRYCIAVIDLDDFKTINDDFGHEAGDQILKRAGEVLQSMCRDEDKPSVWEGMNSRLLFAPQPTLRRYCCNAWILP